MCSDTETRYPGAKVTTVGQAGSMRMGIDLAQEDANADADAERRHAQRRANMAKASVADRIDYIRNEAKQLEDLISDMPPSMLERHGHIIARMINALDVRR